MGGANPLSLDLASSSGQPMASAMPDPMSSPMSNPMANAMPMTGQMANPSPNAMPPLSPAQPMMPSTLTGSSVAGFAPMSPAPVAEPALGTVKTDIIEKLRTANNVLVTVTSSPSVDQLAAAIGITLVLNKLDKHATAVYSGETPSTLEFLQPDKTIEKNTDSLRDFIIALDKAKADKLRYKVEDTFVKIFITPYHTSLSEKDLEFSQGDFNVDVVLALGVHKREELDQAITAHGRILHDAVTISINNLETSDLGAINWFQADASSLCEMLVSLIEPLQGDKVVLDDQVATAFLTGVVAETDRFSNPKTTPHTMNIAATLMKAGANQQLVASKLEAPQPIEKSPDAAKLDALAKDPNADPVPIPVKNNDGSLTVDHPKNDDEENKPGGASLAELEKANHASDDEDEDSDLAKIHIDDQGRIVSVDGHDTQAAGQPTSGNIVTQPPVMGSPMSAVERPEDDGGQPAVDMPAQQQDALQHAKTVQPLSEEEKAQTLDQIEQSVDSPHLGSASSLDADSARQAVDQAAASSDSENRPEPIQALNAQPIDLEKPIDNKNITTEDLLPPEVVAPGQPSANDPTAPPPVPPPMMPLQ